MNIKKYVKILLWGVLLFNSGICIGDGKINFTDPSKPIVVEKSNPKFSIILQSNPTSGYSWFLKNYNENLISLNGKKFTSPPATKKKLAGAPGYETWNFSVKPSSFVVPQITNIVLIYARPWEDQGAQATNFRVVIKNDN